MSYPPPQWPPGPPPGQYGGPQWGPPGPWQQPPPQRPRRMWWLAILAVVVVVAAAVVGVVVVTRGDSGDDSGPTTAAGSGSASPATSTPSSESSAAAAAKAVPLSALSGLLLSPDEGARVIGATAPLIGDFQPPNPEIFDSMVVDDPIVDQECQVLYVAERMAYEGSGYNAARVQFLTSTGLDLFLAQGVVAYSDDAAAQKYMGTAKTAWERCANRTINLRTASDTKADNDFWTVGAVTERDGILMVSRRSEGGGDWICQQGKAARRNIVIDVKVCGDNVPDSVVTDYVARVNDKIEALG